MNNKRIPADVRRVRSKLEAVRAAYKDYLDAAEKESSYRNKISSACAFSFSDVPKREHTGNKSEDKMIRLLTFGEQKASLKQTADSSRQEAEALISMLDSETEKTILRKRYLEFGSWNDIINEMNYDRSWVFRLHNRGLENLSKIPKQ